MKTIQLDQEEQALLEAFESGHFQSELTPTRKTFIEHSAAQTFKKDKRINIRISTHDLVAIQRRALENGIPYQTFVASILHKYVSGGLYDVIANKPIKTDQETIF